MKFHSKVMQEEERNLIGQLVEALRKAKFFKAIGNWYLWIWWYDLKSFLTMKAVYIKMLYLKRTICLRVAVRTEFDERRLN